MVINQENTLYRGKYIVKSIKIDGKHYNVGEQESNPNDFVVRISDDDWMTVNRVEVDFRFVEDHAMTVLEYRGRDELVLFKTHFYRFGILINYAEQDMQMKFQMHRKYV